MLIQRFIEAIIEKCLRSMDIGIKKDNKRSITKHLLYDSFLGAIKEQGRR